MLQNHAWVKKPFKVQNKAIDFHVIRYKKVIDMVSDFNCNKLFYLYKLSFNTFSFQLSLIFSFGTGPTTTILVLNF